LGFFVTPPAQKLEVKTDTSHLDSSSFHLHGKYEQELPSVAFFCKETDENQSDISSTNNRESPVPIKITYGYSRDHRPDLKQFILDLICSGDGDVPLFLRVASGNESDNSIRTYATGTTQFGDRIGKAAELGARLVGSSFTAHCTVEASVIVGQNMRKGVGC